MRLTLNEHDDDISPVYKNEKKYAVLSNCKNFNRIDTVASFILEFLNDLIS